MALFDMLADTDTTGSVPDVGGKAVAENAVNPEPDKAASSTPGFKTGVMATAASAPASGGGFLSGLMGSGGSSDDSPFGMDRSTVKSLLMAFGQSLMSSPRGAPLSGFGKAYIEQQKLMDEQQKKAANVAIFQKLGYSPADAARMAGASPQMAALAMQGQQMDRARQVYQTNKGLLSDSPTPAASPDPVGKTSDAGTQIPGQIDLNPSQADTAIRTVLAEAGSQGEKGMQAVAGVLRNRALLAGTDVATEALKPNQFEPWNPNSGNDPRRFKVDSPEYKAAAAVVLPVLRGEAPDPTGGATHFYAPKAQAALGRKPPSWDDGSGADIGDHRFFRRPYAGKDPSALAQAPAVPGASGRVADASGQIGAAPADPTTTGASSAPPSQRGPATPFNDRASALKALSDLEIAQAHPDADEKTVAALKARAARIGQAADLTETEKALIAARVPYGSDAWLRATRGKSQGVAPNYQLANPRNPNDTRVEPTDGGPADPTTPQRGFIRDPSNPARQVVIEGSPESPSYKGDVAAAGRPDVADEAEARGMGNARAKALEAYATAGEGARIKLEALAQLRGAFQQAGPNLTTGPLSESVLRAKQAVEGAFGIKLPGTTGTELINSLGPQLATAATKELTSRPAQSEFQANLKTKPGLSNSVEGNMVMIDLLAQAAQRKVDLSELALKHGKWDKFAPERDAYEHDNPLMNPFTNKPFSSPSKFINATGGNPAPAGAPKPVQPPELKSLSAGDKLKLIDRLRNASPEARSRILDSVREQGYSPDGF